MRLGLVIYGSLNTLSGGYLYDRHLVDYLRAQGDTVDILSRPWRNYAAHLTDNLVVGWRERLRAGRWEVLIQDELNHPSLFGVNQALKGQVRWQAVSLVHHLRAHEAHPPGLAALYARVERAYLRTVNGFIFNSQTTRQAVQAWVGERVPHVVAPPASRFPADLPEADWLARAREPGPLRVLFVGNLIPRKGLLTVLEAVRRVPDLTLTVVGRETADPAHARLLQQRANQWGLSGRVTWRGQLSDDDLAAALRQHHVLAVPSTYEGFGMVYLEGMAFALPAIGTTAGAARETITPGHNGYLIAPGSATALADHLAHLHTHRATLSDMSRAAQQHAAQHPTWDDSLRAARTFLLGMAGKG